MKRLMFFTLCILIVCTSFAQKIVTNPDVGFSTSSNVSIKKLEINDTATILDFRTEYTPGNWIFIPKESYIQPVGGEKLFLSSAKGIPVGEQYIMPDSGVVHYQLVFPAISDTVKAIDFGEANDGGSWFLYDIALHSKEGENSLPDSYLGAWINATSGGLEYYITQKNVVTDRCLWSVQAFSGSEKKGELTISDGKTEKVLFLKQGKNGEVLIGDSKKSLRTYTKDGTAATKTNVSEYARSVFKYDSVTYSGCVLNYKPRYGQKTGNIYVNNILTGSQETHLVEIQDDGSFSKTFPFYYPHGVFVRMPNYYSSVHLEPGAHLFHIITPSNGGGIFMGDCAAVNTDLAKLNNLARMDYREMQNKILDMDLEAYKAYCFGFAEKGLQELDRLKNEGEINAQAYQIKKFDIEYDAMSNAMEYDWNYENAYREKNKIPRSQRDLGIEIEKTDADYYDFITTENIENPLAVISNNFDTFYNRLKFLPLLRTSVGISHDDILLQMDDSDFTPDEQVLIHEFKKIERLGVSSGMKELSESMRDVGGKFYRKYEGELRTFYEENNHEMDYEKFEEYLNEKGNTLTDTEKEFIAKQKEIAESDYSKMRGAFYKDHSEAWQKLTKAKAERISQLVNLRFEEMRNEQMEKHFGVGQGFATDVFLSEDVCRKVVEEFTPLSEPQLFEVKERITTPFVADYIQLMNDNTIEKINNTKHGENSIVNDVPKTKAEEIFDAILKNYRGKVVLVDFWATWCGPCRSAIKRIAPLKEELKDEDVVFVYITNPSSPEGTYNNMIKTIDGEHYRVSQDEWNYLCGQFNISGIPHYTLVGKQGEVLNPHLSHGLSNEGLKQLFRKNY
ncbi:TlpA disulfide reductase family protein [Draconibacterium sediminis]|uniref:TlpA family protein disulfide reductase n=1 Tax=Draconibacterium sediminis TaxID=1544798 RepID=UPI0026E9A8F6|nr:TlpA disulfide reductase family protein [Draconibacterium sediminis]